jgi:lycopene elongase/hydratase (dihydrobisanhydrobacterioruberin-forming)
VTDARRTVGGAYEKDSKGAVGDGAAKTVAVSEQGRSGSPLGQIVVALWRLARPPIWMVSLVPLWVGNLLATRTIVAGYTLSEVQPLLLAMVVLGPLGWAAALAINDVYDLAGDLGNHRKQNSPLVSGALSPRFARRAAYGFAMATLVGAAAVSTGFLVVTAAFLVLAWCYSVPPVRLKSRAGADVLVNAIGVGALPLLAGWTVNRPLVSFPWIMLAQGVAVAVALYVPTTLVDHDADLAAGYDTLSTRLGYAGAYQLGLVAWTCACVGAAVLSFLDVVIPKQMLPILVVAAPVLAAAYHFLIGRARESAQLVRGIIVVSWMFLVPNVMFALMYTGLWVPGR